MDNALVERATTVVVTVRLYNNDEGHNPADEDVVGAVREVLEDSVGDPTCDTFHGPFAVTVGPKEGRMVPMYEDDLGVLNLLTKVRAMGLVPDHSDDPVVGRFWLTLAQLRELGFE